MNIAVIRTNTANFGRIGTYNVQEIGLSNALIKAGHNAKVIYLYNDVKQVKKDDIYDNVYYFPSETIGLHGIFNVRLLNMFNLDLIILFSDNQLWAKNVIKWSEKNNVKCICYWGAVLSNNPHFLNQFYTKLILKRNFNSYKRSFNVAKTIAVKEEMEHHGIKVADVINVGLDSSLLYKGIYDKAQARKDLKLDADANILLYVGRFISYKRPLFIVQLLQYYLKQGKKMHIVMIGKGNLEAEVKRYIEDNNLSSYVTHMESVMNSDMYKWYLASDCFINFSAIEIFGMAMLESMYYGTPVVARDAPGPREFLKDGANGYICYSDDLDEWVNKINKALLHDARIIAKAKKKVTEEFLWDSTASKFLEVVTEI